MLSEASNLGIFSVLIPTPSQASLSVSLAATSGSYTTINDTLVIAVKPLNGSPTLQGLLAPITTSDMVALLIGNENMRRHSEEEPIQSLGDAEQDIVLKDDDYYLCMVNFEFEDVQFLVPQWRFPENSTLNLSSDQDTHTITQDDVSALDFRRLMEFMYPFDSSPFPVWNWVSVLKLSSVWHMKDYRRQAFSSHSFFYLEPEEKFVLGRLCGIPSWYRQGCIGLACGDSQLRASHEATIGIEAMVKIARARDAAYRGHVASYHERFPAVASFVREITDSSAPEYGSYSTTCTASSIMDDIREARANRCLSWLRSCYERLVDREESINLEEVTTLGLETTMDVWKSRLRLFQEYWRVLGSSLPEPDFTTHIEAEFVDELAEVRSLQNMLDSPSPQISVSLSSEALPLSMGEEIEDFWREFPGY